MWQLIQRLVTSNPSSNYVARVAAVFVNNGQGARGDLRAVVRAILLDPEAVVDSAAGLPVDVELAELRERVVPGADRPALDSVVLFRTR